MNRTLVPVMITPPAAYPVSVAEIRTQLAIDTDDYDARLAGLIATATEDAEDFLGMALITRSYQGFLDHWPHRREGARTGMEATTGDYAGYGRAAREVELPMPPLISVDYVKTYDDTDTATVFDPSNYFVDTASTFGRMRLRNGCSWPIPTRTANGIEIGWTCGVGTTLRPFQDDKIRLAIIVAVGALNEMRGDETQPDGLPKAARDLLGSRRLTWL